MQESYTIPRGVQTNVSRQRIVAKVVLCGGWQVGKTELRRRYMGETFIQDHLSTLGADYSVKKVKLDEDTIIELQIWDLASQPGFESLRQRFFKGTSAAIMVFDLERPETFKEFDSWFEQLWRGMQEKAMPIAIIGNKSHLNNDQITEEEVMKYIEKLKTDNDIHDANIFYIKTNEKTGENINHCLHNLATSLFELLKD
ncbi:MAG: Transforming protein p29 precursor [Candidatus Heimdallarchaeota archaeon LC_2]|nr:MAG: Transforming protein p29 precursor [Candidatus Heimdallarchaeota archaeon LC_2]